MANRIQLRRGGAQEWANANSILAQGELGIEIDTGRIKIGDGITPWNSLRYERPLESVSSTANTLVQRDADGNFAAGNITATLIGSATSAQRLTTPRQIQLTQDITGSAVFDGSANLNISALLQVVNTLPHYDGTSSSSGTYTKLTVDAKGRITNASTPSSYIELGLNDVQPLDPDLTSFASLSALGMVSRTAPGVVQARTLLGTTGRIQIADGNAVAGNPTFDLVSTTIAAEAEFLSATGQYNIPAIISTGGDDLPLATTRTVNTTRFTVDQWGRFTSAKTIPIATAIEGTKAAAFNSGTTYARYSLVTSSGNLYQSISSVASGGSAPSHTNTSDTGGWRYLGAAGTVQKGLASFAQEDFDVDTNGHVTIAAAGVDNTQLQNNKLIFTDGNSVTNYELDNEHTTATGYTGFTTINTLRVNNTSGDSLLHVAHNQDLDVNTSTATIFSDITLDKTSTAIQTINRAGSLTILMDANTASNRFLRLTAENAGAGEAKMEITADNDISIQSLGGDVIVEDIHFNGSTIFGNSSAGTITIDPYPAGGNTTGTVSILGDLVVQGTTTTVNSTVVTIDDPVITLGGDTAPTMDDSKDRGIEFRYYDTQARLGFFGWDDSYSTLAGTSGGYRFLYNASNTSEVFSGTDAGVIAGNLALTSNVTSTSNTTGTLVVTGGTGISGNLNVGGASDFDGRMDLANSFNLTAAGQWLRVNNGTSNVFYVSTDTGNTQIWGSIYQYNNQPFTTNGSITINGATQYLLVQNGSNVTKFSVASDTGNTSVSGTLGVTAATTLSSTLGVTGATTLSSTLGVTGATTITGNLTLQSGSYLVSSNVDEPTIVTDGSSNYVISGGDYGAFRFDGGGYIAKDVLFSSDIYVNGTIIVKDTGGGGTASTVNNLAVRYTSVLGSTLPYTPSFATHTTSNLRVTGGAGIATTLHIGGTGANEGLYVGKRNSGDTVKFSVLGASGNTSISGTLGVTGVTTLSSTLGVTGATTLSSTLGVTGNTTLTGTLTANSNVTLGDASADTLTVNATSTFNSSVTLSGSNTLTVGGNATIGGNLTVNGTTTTVNSTVMTIDDPILTLGGDTAPTSDDNKDRGIEFRYFDTQARLGFFGWDDSANQYVFLRAATNASEVFTGTDSALRAGSLNLTGAGTSLDVDANANIDGTLTVDGQITSNVATGAAPFIVASTTKVTNLNADLLDGLTTSSTSVASTVVTRDASSNFAANIITVNSGTGASAGIQGNALTADTLKTTRNIAISGVVSGNVNFNGGSDVTITTAYVDSDISALASQTTETAYLVRTGDGTYARRTFAVSGTGLSVTNADGVAGNTTFTVNTNSSSAANSIVLRDANGNFSAGTITANLTGTATQVSNTLSLGTYLSFSSGTSYNGSIARTINILATSTNTASQVVVRDASGNFAAGTITATLTGNVTGNLTGNADTATTLQTTRTIALSGDATGSATFNGGANATITTTLANSGVVAGQYTKVTVDAKGRVTSGATASTADLTENINAQFFTAERAQDAVASALTEGEAIDIAYNDVANTITISAEDATSANKGVASFTPDHLTVTSGNVKISQTFLENALLQLKAMLDNLDNTTTLTIRHTSPNNTGLTIGDTFVGSVSGATGTITALNSGTVKSITADTISGFFVAGETLTFSTGGVANGETRIVHSTPFE